MTKFWFSLYLCINSLNEQRINVFIIVFWDTAFLKNCELPGNIICKLCPFMQCDNKEDSFT